MPRCEVLKKRQSKSSLRENLKARESLKCGSLGIRHYARGRGFEKSTQALAEKSVDGDKTNN